MPNPQQQNPFQQLFSGLQAPKINLPSFNQPPTAYSAQGAPYSPANGISSPFKTTQGMSFPAPNPASAAAAPKPLVSAPPVAAAPAASPIAPTATAANTAAPQNFTTPNGGQVTVGAGGQVTGFQQAPGYSINTGTTVPSDALNSNYSFQNLTSQRNQYADYLQGLAKAQMPSADYINALSQYKNAQTQGMQIQADYLTNPQYPGDTYGFAQGVAGRQNALNSLQQQSAASSLAVQEAIRSGNIDAYKALVQGAAPQTLGYGQALQSPLGGAPIAVGQNQPSFSAVASPFGGYMVFNQRTGQYTPISGDQLYGGTATGGQGAPTTLPSFLQPALGNIAGNQYLDMSVITPQQIPYAQQVSAQTGIPLLSKDDVNKVQDAQTTYQSGIGLINNVASLASSLITADNPASALAQAASLNIQANVPGTQAKLYQDARNGFLSLITRAAGEKGTLAQGDVERIQAALPSFSDTKQTAATKIQTLSNIFQSAVQANISSRIGSKMGNKSVGAGGTGTGTGTGTGGTGGLYDW